ncbi:AraC family transcriptional regulator [Acinetobacter junii]|uniref:AraC family transcriptional regulator n=1 Tax=Acinetobacter junii TaxID=40215 RepID=UPI003215A64D
MDTAELYTISNWVNVIIDFLEDNGEDRQYIFEMLELSPNFMEIDEEVPFSKISKLWGHAYKLHGTTVGLQISNYFRPNNWAILGVALQTSTTIDDFLIKVSQYYPLISNAVELRYEKSNIASKKLVTRFVQPVEYEAERMEAYIGAGIKLLNLMTGTNQVSIITQVDLVRPIPLTPEPWHELFGKNILWEAQEFAIHLSDTTLSYNIPFKDKMLSNMIDQNLSARLSQKKSLSPSQIVKNEILKLLPNGKPTLKIIAARMNLSPRSLQRHLDNENLHFGKIVESIQLKMAEEYLKITKKTIYEISILTGFSNQSNFSNAFKKWKKITPNQYRKIHQSKKN